MDNTNIKAPKLNISNIKSPLSGGGSDLGGVDKGGTSKVGTLAKIVRKNRISINSLVKSQEIQDEKITRLKNISQIKQQNAGKKSPVEDISSSLVETNKILVAIQSQLALQSQNEQEEEKENIRRESAAESKRKLKREESVLEKTAKGIGKAVGKVALKIVQPIGGIFDKILEFITLMGTGIAVNAAFEWFKDEENQKKISKFFNIVKENWRLLRNILLTVVGVGLAVKVAAAVSTIGAVLAMLANPIVLGVLAGALAGYGLYKAAREGVVGGPGFVEAHDMLDASLKNAGITNDGKNAKNKSVPLTQAQQELFDNVKTKRTQLYDLKRKQDREADAAGNKVGKGTPLGQGTYSNELAYEQARGVVLKKYSNLARELVGLPARAMGGPVTAGQPYLVGERGPEIFSPNINGSIVNNMRTEKIVQTLSSDMGEGSINMIELPPITNQLPPPEIPVPSGPATEVPEVSSVNLADPYRQLTPMLYGITV